MAKKFGSRHSAGREGGREGVGQRSADEGKIYIRGVTKLRRQGGGRRLKRPTTSGEMTLGPRHEGPTTICIPATTRMLGERGKGGGGIFDQYSGVFDVGGGPLIESDIGGQKALLRREQRKEHLRLTRRTGHFMASSSHCDPV